MKKNPIWLSHSNASEPGCVRVDVGVCDVHADVWKIIAFYLSLLKDF